MDTSMTESATLLNSQLGFLNTHVALISFPLELLPNYQHAILNLLLHVRHQEDGGSDLQPPRPWLYWHPFVNITVTPSECSIICPRAEADTLFVPVRQTLAPHLKSAVSISKDDFSVVVIGGAGLEAGQRVLDLSTPLAMAGIPIFFFTSYWSDYILVPFKMRSRVIRALEERGFVFEADADGESGHMTNPASPLLQPHLNRSSSQSDFDFPQSPATPPPSTLSDLQARTFKLLSKNKVEPTVDRTIGLVTCAGVKDSTASSQKTNFTQGKLELGLVRCLTSEPLPNFFSVTLTDAESASLTLDKHLLRHFANDGEDVLLGNVGSDQIAITLDLKDLPTESTGIVCGVASRILDGMKGRVGRELFDMSYLSTAKAGHVIVYEDELEEVLKALRGMQVNGASADC
ncbi:hypothetical protein BAUCODRAFT_226785 [Baudoinia panamericana UAMH 10762]|uniref:CASTOR ACT domain-containing protein n=1 Tax=Baudoinia panamericana (strain UAMH 10762) TaxID=717646 RepID=M2MCK2_BAUPA|nr:uncharacterized protein BAUCODRAFT_226785 [Baudoinia panamericana UAMH 10762]EMC94256.1 hypothetical protein BAUCODRAFT_226785 [Baudoinia panamericana UAMH 10762]